MDKLSYLEMKIGGVNCPNCMHAALVVQMRCDLGYQDCFYIAKCSHCGHSFDIETDPHPLADRYEALQKALREQGCANCGSIKLDLSMRCDMDGRKCYYVATCDLCDYQMRIRGVTGPLPASLASLIETRA